MQKSGMWLPILASLGIGAATYYIISKNNQSLGQTMQKVIPFVSQMTESGTTDTQHLGPHGMS